MSLMPNYNRQSVTFVKGEGAWLWDTEGNRYLDALSGIAVCGLGHAHPAVAEAIATQAHTLIHTSNLYHVAHQQTLATQLTQRAEMETAFFCNSGAEANEAAIKIARLYGNQRQIELPTIVVMENAFHGRTLATLTATGNRKIQTGFSPLVQGFIRIPYNDIPALRQIARENNNIVAVLLEPVQGEGGIHIPAADYLNQIRTICDENQWLMMLDEVQTGVGRTGYWYAFQANGIHPDVITSAKGLGNGMPIGACLARGTAAHLFTAGTHGTTFGGNPLACQAALAVLNTIERDNLLTRATLLGDRIQAGFEHALQGLNSIRDIRHKGLMMGIELEYPCAALVNLALQQRLLINVTAERVIRLLPPLIFTDEQADELVSTLSALIRHFIQTSH